jgi:hypothetical protein
MSEELKTPTRVIGEFELTLNDEDGEGNTTRTAYVSVASSHPHDTAAAANYMARLADLPTMAARYFADAEMYLTRGPVSKARDCLVEGLRISRLLRDSGELEGL